MPRRNASKPTLPRAHLIADREVRRALGQARNHSFGIRRPVEQEAQASIVDHLIGLQEIGKLPYWINLRSELHSTLLPQRAIGRQLLRGFADGKELRGRVNARLDRKVPRIDQATAIAAKVVGVEVYRGRHICLKIESPTLKGEAKSIEDVLGQLGVRGFRSVGTQITLGETPTLITQAEQADVIDVIQDGLPLADDNTLALLGWDVYPELAA